MKRFHPNKEEILYAWELARKQAPDNYEVEGIEFYTNDRGQSLAIATARHNVKSTAVETWQVRGWM